MFVYPPWDSLSFLRVSSVVFHQYWKFLVLVSLNIAFWPFALISHCENSIRYVPGFYMFLVSFYSCILSQIYTLFKYIKHYLIFLYDNSINFLHVWFWKFSFQMTFSSLLLWLFCPFFSIRLIFLGHLYIRILWGLRLKLINALFLKLFFFFRQLRELAE